MATVTYVVDRHVKFNDKQFYTVGCEENGWRYEATTSQDYSGCIGWKVPVRVSTFRADLYEVLLEEMLPPELLPPEIEEAPVPPRVQGPATWSWDESGVNRKNE